MKAVIGLGNPGKKYESTRHNVGFDVVSKLAQRYGLSAGKLKFEAELFETLIGPEKVLLVKPLTFMNLSGRSVRQIIDFYKLDPAGIIVVCDDLNLDTGRLRLRGQGSSGGQKGLQNIIDQLGGRTDFARLRVGIGRPAGKMSVTDFVLKRFTKHEMELIEPAVLSAADAVEHWIQSGLLTTMNKFNTSPAAQKALPKNETPEASS